MGSGDSRGRSERIQSVGNRSLYALRSFGRRLSKSGSGSLQHAAWHRPWPPARQNISDRPSWGFQRPHAGGHLERCRDGTRSGGCTASERRRSCGVGLLSYYGEGTGDGFPSLKNESQNLSNVECLLCDVLVKPPDDPLTRRPHSFLEKRFRYQAHFVSGSFYKFSERRTTDIRHLTSLGSRPQGLFLRRGSRFGHVITGAGSGLKRLIGEVDTDPSEGAVHPCVAWTVADLILRPQLIVDVEKTTGKILKLEGEKRFSAGLF